MGGEPDKVKLVVTPIVPPPVPIVDPSKLVVASPAGGNAIATLGAAAPAQPMFAGVSDDQILGMLQGSDGTYYAGWVLENVDRCGGLRAFERQYPKAGVVLRQRVVAFAGEPVYTWLLANDAMLLHLVQNSRQLQQHASALADKLAPRPITTGMRVALDLVSHYELDYAIAATGYKQAGSAVLLQWGLMLDDLDAAAAAIEATVQENQTDAEVKAATATMWKSVALLLLGQHIATKERLFWADHDIALAALLAPQDGVEDWNAALAWARLAQCACAIVQLKGRYFIYALNHDYDYDDIWEAEQFEEHRTALVPDSSGVPDTRAIVTNDGYVVTPRDGQRFFGGDQAKHQGAYLRADLQILEDHGDTVDASALLRQLALDILLLRLSDAEAGLRHARAQLMPDYIFDPAQGAALQDRTSELRFHIIQAAQLVYDVSDHPTDAERSAIEDELERIGQISSEDPVAASLVVNHRDDADKSRPKASDYEDRVADMKSGDALSLALGELDEKLANVDKVRRYFYANPDAVYAFTGLIDAAREQFPDSQQLAISLHLFAHTMAEIADFLEMSVKELGLLVLGLVAEGPAALAVWAYGSLRGIAGVQQQFREADRLAAMANLDFAGGMELASPDEVRSARRWAWIGLGLSILDAGLFVRSASHMLRLRAVLADPELASVMRFADRPIGDIARALGKSERGLVAELATARGAARDELIAKIRNLAELSPPWHSGWQVGLAASDATIRAETVAMELHPQYQARLAEAHARGFDIVPTNGDPRVEVMEIVDETGKRLELRKRLHLQPGMRFLDLEHEMSHIDQIERFVEPPITHRFVRTAQGDVQAVGNQARGILTTEQNAILEYHNRLSEMVRLEKTTTREVLLDEFQGAERYRIKAENKAGLGRGDNFNTRWAKQYFPDIPELEERVRQMGFDLKPKTSRW
jgi:hypothetical protein